MGFIIQIILSIVAWNRGWKWLALIPIAAALVIGILIGFIGGSMGYSPEDMRWSIIFDVIVFIILIYMCVKPYKSSETNSEKLPEENK